MKLFTVLLVSVALYAAGCEANPEYPPAPVAGEVQVVNASSTDYHVLRFRKADDIDWSKDYLGGGTIIPSGGEVIYFMPTGTFDFLVENLTLRYFVEFKSITIVHGQRMTLTIID